MPVCVFPSCKLGDDFTGALGHATIDIGRLIEKIFENLEVADEKLESVANVPCPGDIFLLSRAAVCRDHVSQIS